MESFFSNLKSIGVAVQDIDILRSLVRKFANFNIFQVLKSKSSCDRAIYHEAAFSQSFKMLLRLLVGISLFRGLDKPHRDAIFFAFEHKSKRDLADLRQLEEFWALTRRFFANHLLSSVIYNIIKREMSEGQSELINTLNEFNIPYSITRSKSHHLTAIKEVKRCLPRHLKRERELRQKERQKRYAEQRMHEWTRQIELDHEQFQTGYKHGHSDGNYDGTQSGCSDAVHDLKCDYRFQMRPNHDKSTYYQLGYTSGYKASFKFWYNFNYHHHRDNSNNLGRRLNFD